VSSPRSGPLAAGARVGCSAEGGWAAAALAAEGGRGACARAPQATAVEETVGGGGGRRACAAMKETAAAGPGRRPEGARGVDFSFFFQPKTVRGVRKQGMHGG